MLARFIFSHWEDGSTDNPRTLNLTSDMILNAIRAVKADQTFTRDLEQEFKKETGLDAYVPNDLQSEIPSSKYVQWLENQVVTTRSTALCKCGLAQGGVSCCDRTDCDMAI